MKILILMYYDENVKSYADNCKGLNENYCKKNNYDFICSNETFLPYKSGHYQRYPLILKHIEKYDWVMWIDADAFFYNDAPRLETLINHIQFSHEIILSYSIKQYLSDEYDKNFINNGVFLFKNTKNNIKIIEKIIDSDDIKDISHKKHYTYDQSIFRYLYEINYLDFKKNSFVLNYGALQHFYEHELGYLKYKPFILHMAGDNSEKRKEISKKYYDYYIYA